MKSIFPFRPISATAVPQPIEMHAIALPDKYLFNGQQKPLQAYLDKTVSTSLVVYREGKLVSETYLNGSNASSQHTSWSVAKSFVVTLIGMAVLEGKIQSIDDQAERYIPELKGKAYGETSIRNLMRMASGVKFSEVYTDKTSDINKLFMKVFILGQGVNQAVANQPREVAQGSRFSYVSSDSQVLAWVLTSIYKKPLAAIIQEKIWLALGMEHDAYWSVDRAPRPQGDSSTGAHELGYCCLNATSKDFARLGLLYLQDGLWQGKRLLPEGWVKMVTRPSTSWLEPGAVNPTQPNGTNGIRGYGMQFWVPENYDGEYFANGVWGQSIWVSEKTNTVIVRTAVDANYREHLKETYAVMRAISAPR